ncbi:MerR family transcriptional regulator [Actinomadura sp. NPDC047616]|uniref:MerR family transcriptional regulator n=1 Tax=Actinomadura sp. NPDC047616 TaxID=3155914 RepID=UPI0033DADC28
MAVTDDTTRDPGLGIGDLARLTGVPVRTIRFYCDEGVLDARRSAGGHRRFDRDAVDRLRLVRRLRGFGLGLPAIVQVLNEERSLGEAVAAERAALDVELAALAWRRARLRALEEARPAGRAARLELLERVEDGHAARDALVAFWRGLIVGPLPKPLRDAFVEVSVPEPPDDPTPAQVVAYAEMVTLAQDRSLTTRMRALARGNAPQIADLGALMVGVGEAWRLVAPALLAGRTPEPGPALDRFVDAHVQVRHGRRDSPEFRRELYEILEPDLDPRLERYWRLVSEITGDVATLGAAQAWLVRALCGCVRSEQ